MSEFTTIASVRCRRSDPRDQAALSACLRDPALQRALFGTTLRADERERYVIDMTRRDGWDTYRVAGFVATVGDDERIAGAACVHDGYLSFFVVEPHRGRGIAGTLLGHVASTLSTWGAERLVACVEPGNTASRRVLERLGFRELERAPFTTARGAAPRSLVVYAKALKGRS
jgi:RimJ/RimL family protein N-acetyltransferase